MSYFDHESPETFPETPDEFPPEILAVSDRPVAEAPTPSPFAVPPSPSFPPPPPGNSHPSSRRWGPLVGTAALCAVLSAGVSVATVKLVENDTKVSYVQTSDGSSGTASPTTDIHTLLAKVEPAVAAIEISDGSTDTPTPIAAGSGVVISSDGLMLTNAHVVNVTDAGGRALAKPVITVKMADGTVRSAKVLGASSDYDVAVLRLADTTDLHPLTLADTTRLRVGDRVVAIGNALDLGDAPTVSTGIVSALNRTLAETSSTTLRGLIQTDAAINHGNSGGALVNMSGELIGINSAGIPDAQNIGFAISVGTIRTILDDLKAGKPVKPAGIGYIGVNLSETPDGIVVSNVQDGTPAKKAGIVNGDVIVSVNDEKVSTANQLANVLQGLAPGTKVSVTVRRGTTTKNFELTLAVRPAN
jgi:putative serine protease PepD